jgi:hypothetical protein
VSRGAHAYAASRGHSSVLAIAHLQDSLSSGRN